MWIFWVVPMKNLTKLTCQMFWSSSASRSHISTKIQTHQKWFLQSCHDQTNLQTRSFLNSLIIIWSYWSSCWWWHCWTPCCFHSPALLAVLLVWLSLICWSQLWNNNIVNEQYIIWTTDLSKYVLSWECDGMFGGGGAGLLGLYPDIVDVVLTLLMMMLYWVRSDSLSLSCDDADE